MDDGFPPTVTCSGCGREVPNGVIYCPHCCGADGRQAAIVRGALLGAAFGALVGCLLAGLWYLLLGFERATWGRSFGVLVACATTGALWGMLRRGRR